MKFICMVNILNTHRYKITYFKKLDSTNSYALKNISLLSDRDVILADIQTAGRGRFNRNWISDTENNLYMSIVLKPSQKTDNKYPMANLTQYISVALCNILENYGVKAEIKWPNDVFVNNKKIAGILAQSSIQGEDLKGFVLGLGVNLNLKQEKVDQIDQPATSLNLVLGQSIDKNLFTEKILNEFFKNYEKFLKNGFSYIKKDYLSRSNFIGKKITVCSSQSKIKGTAKEIKEDGTLILLTENNQEKIIAVGDIFYL